MLIDFKKEVIFASKTLYFPGSLTNFIKLILENDIDNKYIVRALIILLVNCTTIPIKIIEYLKFGQKVKEVDIQDPPIFIIGHWRSGTTYLHNLMAQDPNFGYVSTLQAFAPEMFLTLQEWGINQIKLGKRPQDNIFLSLDSPQEEEIAIANMCPYSFYHATQFPRNSKNYFDKFILFDGVNKKIKNAWQKIYIDILKKSTFNCNGKRLVLKNPFNTARTKLLLEIFPNAKFIHIYRNPYVVYASTKHMWNCFHQLQEISEEDVDNNIINNYNRIMHEFFYYKKNISKQNLIEVKYEDLIGNELKVLKKIYEQLNIPHFEQLSKYLQKYLVDNSQYKTNKYSFDDKTIAKVYNAWKLTIDLWQYSPPELSKNEEN